MISSGRTWRLLAAAPTAALLLGALFSGAGCRSAAKPGPRAVGPGRQDPLAGLVGQVRILRHRGDKGKWSVKRQDLRSASGGCDIAVSVRHARFDRGTAVLTLDMLGRPRLARRGARQERCGDDQAQIVVTVSGFEPSASTAEIEAGLADALLTPEGYLRVNSVAYEPPAPPKPPEDGKSAKAEPAAAIPGFKVEALKVDVPVADHHLTRKPTKVLWVDAITRDPRGKISHEAEVQFTAVVGFDGRLHHPKIGTALSDEHEKVVLRVLPLWRYDPARRGQDAAASAVNERLVFRIY
jgi:hypothetical protein